ncbi:hypothetical protein BTVI_143666 [Pitangus sulphuratus]|nr:hypothetical protein BTVI_143666 [Pitangus sulphuratus]
MLDNPFHEEIFPEVQPEPPLVQLEAISSCPVASFLEEKADLNLATTSFQVYPAGRVPEGREDLLLLNSSGKLALND